MKRLASPETGRAQSQKELEGKNALYKYFREYHGCQAELSRTTGINIAVLSKMANQPEYVITLDAAMMIEIATMGALRTETLCPSRAPVIREFIRIRADEMATA